MSFFFIPICIAFGVAYFGYILIRNNYIQKSKIPSRLELALSFAVLIMLSFLASLFSFPASTGMGMLGIILFIIILGFCVTILVFLVSFFDYKEIIKFVFKSTPLESVDFDLTKKEKLSSFHKYVLMPLFIIGLIVFSSPVLNVAGRNLSPILSPIKNKFFPEIPLYTVSSTECILIVDDKQAKKISSSRFHSEIIDGVNEQIQCLNTEMNRQVATSQRIDCDYVAQRIFKDEKQYLDAFGKNYITENYRSLKMNCDGLQVVQKALLDSSPELCNQIESNFLKNGLPKESERGMYNPSGLGRYDVEVAKMHATCVVNYYGTQTWSEGCAKYTNTKSEWLNVLYNKLAQCGIKELDRGDGEKYFDELNEIVLPEYYFKGQTTSTTTVNIEALNEDTLITKAKIYLSGEPIPWMNDLQAELDTNPDMIDMVTYVKNDEYSIQEVSNHSSKQNCWIAYRFHTFDITKLLTLKDIFQSILGLESKCGADVTEYIDSMPTVAGSLNTARFKYALDLFYIGSISESGTLEWVRGTNSINKHDRDFGVSINYMSSTECDPQEQDGDYYIETGDGGRYVADCKGVIDHIYTKEGIYEVQYIHDDFVVGKTMINI